MSDRNPPEAVDEHYGRAGLEKILLDSLREAGKDPNHLSYKDLAPFDQFHSRGREATLELARLAELRERMKILDIGGGLGGSARILASEFGCHVTVLDLTKEFCDVGTKLTERTGLNKQVEFKNASALDMPFSDGEFDVVWTQHSTMNIENKKELYAKIHTVLNPGGKLAMHEILVGPVQPIHFPVPWARDPSISFLISPEETQELISKTGFRQLEWTDDSARSLEWFRQRAVSSGGTRAPLGLNLLLGPLFQEAFTNQVLNLEENRIAIIQAVFARKS
jgi:SAM-dependent methyltransferase